MKLHFVESNLPIHIEQEISHQEVDAIYADFSKALDESDHNISLKMLGRLERKQKQNQICKN